jgi:hypothetical protein
MVEKQFQTIFGNWLKANPPARSAVFELKLEKGKSIRFDAVREHQIQNLMAVKRGAGLYYKIVDSPMTYYGGQMRFTAKKPYDCQFLIGIETFVVVLFYKPRQPKYAIFVEPEKWIEAQKEYSALGKMSIKEEDLRKIGQIYLIK